MLSIRVDDFPFTKPEESWKHNLDNFKRFDAIFEKHNLDYVLGVIPRWTTEEHVRWLAENPRIEVALHGIMHDEKFLNEFPPYLTSDDICKLILSARTPLNDCNPGGVKIYIPPHNVIDHRTVDALKKSGFTTIYGGPETSTDVMTYAMSQGIQSLCHMPPLQYGRSDELMANPNFLTRLTAVGGQGHSVNLGLHWTWEWNIGLEHLDLMLTSLLRSINEQRPDWSY